MIVKTLLVLSHASYATHTATRSLPLPDAIIREIGSFVMTVKRKYLQIMRDPEYHEFTDQMIAIAASQSFQMSPYEASKQIWGLGKLDDGLLEQGELGRVSFASDILSDSARLHLNALGLKTRLAAAVNEYLKIVGRCKPEALKALWSVKSSTVLDFSFCKAALSHLQSERYPEGLRVLSLRFVVTDQTDLSSLQLFPLLTSLNVEDHFFPGMESLTTLAPLAGLTRLESLSFEGTGITSLELLRDFANLKYLRVSSLVTSLEPLRGLANLVSLTLAEAQVTSIEPLAGLTGLEVLDLSGTQVENLSPIRGMTQLRVFRARNLPIVDFGPLQYLTNLEVVDLGRSRIVDLEPLRGAVNLKELNLAGTGVKSLEPIRGFGLITLDVSKTAVSDVSVIAGLGSLKSLRISERLEKRLRLTGVNWRFTPRRYWQHLTAEDKWRELRRSTYSCLVVTFED